MAAEPAPPRASTGAETGKKFVRVKGTRLGRYVEFEFSINDADLTVELILPFAAFDEFCAMQNAIVLPPAAETAAELEQLAWRSGQPGLLRRVLHVTDADPTAELPQGTPRGEF